MVETKDQRAGEGSIRWLGLERRSLREGRIGIKRDPLLTGCSIINFVLSLTLSNHRPGVVFEY
jgi:hypothetical protein